MVVVIVGVVVLVVVVDVVVVVVVLVVVLVDVLVVVVWVTQIRSEETVGATDSICPEAHGVTETHCEFCPLTGLYVNPGRHGTHTRSVEVVGAVNCSWP